MDVIVARKCGAAANRLACGYEGSAYEKLIFMGACDTLREKHACELLVR